MGCESKTDVTNKGSDETTRNRREENRQKKPKTNYCIHGNKQKDL